MTYTIEEIKKILKKLWDSNCWVPFDNGKFLNFYPIISELVEEVEFFKSKIDPNFLEDLEWTRNKHKKVSIHEAAKCALEHLEASGRREDIQKILREALG